MDINEKNMRSRILKIIHLGPVRWFSRSRWLVTKPGDLSSIPGTHVVKGRTNPYKLTSSDLHMQAMAHQVI